MMVMTRIEFIELHGLLKQKKLLFLANVQKPVNNIIIIRNYGLFVLLWTGERIKRSNCLLLNFVSKNSESILYSHPI